MKKNIKNAKLHNYKYVKGSNFMLFEDALEIVHKAAEDLFKKHGEMTAKTPDEMQTALNVVEDYIVNHCGEY